MKNLFLLIVLLCGLKAEAATYYVKTAANGGSDSNPGTSVSPFLTIAFAESVSAPDDFIRVQSGTYNEQPTINQGGTAGHRITYVADSAGGAVICRGFSLTGVSYVSLVGFEVTHTNTTFINGINYSGTCSYIWIIDNYVHNVHCAQGAIVAGAGTFSYFIIRGNQIDDTGYINGVQSESSRVGISLYQNASSYCLIEYNVAHRLADWVYMQGNHQVARNNSFTDYEDRSLPTVQHVDGFQSGSDTVQNGTRIQIYENNWDGNRRNTDSHFGLWQDVPHASNPGVHFGDTSIIIRGNVGYHLGSGAIGVISTLEVKTFNNTWHDVCYLAPNAGNFNVIGIRALGADTYKPTNCTLVNTIISSDKNWQALNISASAVNTRSAANIGYQVSTHASYVSILDPLFVEPATLRDFRLQSGSPARNAGTYQTTVSSADGSGTSFDVSDALVFSDGFGIMTGDLITVSGNSATRITAISGSTITVANSQTWTNGAPAYWGSSTTPDIGAFPYGSSELTAAAIGQRSVTNYVVAPTGDARGVWYYVDGIPTFWTEDAPYAFTNTTGTVTAKVYALYAQQSPVVLSTAEVAPSLSALSLQSISKNGFVDVTLTTADDITTAANLAITVTSGNDTLIDDNDCVIAWNGSAWVVTCTPNLNQTGSASITVRSTDEGGNYTETSFTLSVHESAYPNQTGGKSKKRR